MSKDKFTLMKFGKVMLSAFALSLGLYILIFIAALFIFNDGMPFTLDTGRKLFLVMYVVSIPLVIKYMK